MWDVLPSGYLVKVKVAKLMTRHAPIPHQPLWQMHDIVPRARNREVIEVLLRSTAGVDQGLDETLIMHASRLSLADTCGGIPLGRGS